MIRDVRAAAVLFHLLAVLILSIPVPPAAVRGEARDPRTEAMLASWADAGASLGLPRDSVLAVIHGFSKAQHAVLTAIRKPFRPYARLVGAEQSWLMFGTVSDEGARLEVYVSVERRWVPIYVARSSEHVWNRALLDQERMRTLVYNFGVRRSHSKWEPFVDWVAARVREDHPDAWAVRVQMRRLRIPDPETLERAGALEVGSPFWSLQRRLRP